jgi:hypothetical protein
MACSHHRVDGEALQSHPEAIMFLARRPSRPVIDRFLRDSQELLHTMRR